MLGLFKIVCEGKHTQGHTEDMIIHDTRHIHIHPQTHIHSSTPPTTAGGGAPRRRLPVAAASAWEATASWKAV